MDSRLMALNYINSVEKIENGKDNQNNIDSFIGDSTWWNYLLDYKGQNKKKFFTK